MNKLRKALIITSAIFCQSLLFGQNPYLPLWEYIPDGEPYVFEDPDRPGEYRDVSSAAIIASALYRLYSITGDKSYFDAADKMILSLSKAPYLAEPGTNGGFLLKHSVGSIPHGSYIDVPLNYADYYFLEALIRRKNL